MNYVPTFKAITTVEAQAEFHTRELFDNILNPKGGVVVRHNLGSTSGVHIWALLRWEEYNLQDRLIAELKESE